MGSLCQAIPGVCFPHEMFGYERNDVPGILLSIEILNELNKKQEAYAKTNKGKSAARKARAPRRPTKKHR